MTYHARERGSVAGFVIGGLVLLGLLAGGIYVVRNNMLGQGSQVATTQTAGTPADKTDTTKTDDNADIKAALAKQAEEAQKAKEKQQAEQKAAEKAAAEKNAQSTMPATGGSSATSGATTTGHLPTTGPEEVIIPALGAMLLAGVSVAFARSRALL